MGKAKNTARKTTGRSKFPPGYTKQTAEKSTGAPAPLTVLPLRSGKAGGRKAIVTATPATSHSKNGVEELGDDIENHGSVVKGGNDVCPYVLPIF